MSRKPFLTLRQCLEIASFAGMILIGSGAGQLWQHYAWGWVLLVAGGIIVSLVLAGQEANR